MADSVRRQVLAKSVANNTQAVFPLGPLVETVASALVSFSPTSAPAFAGAFLSFSLGWFSRPPVDSAEFLKNPDLIYPSSTPFQVNAFGTGLPNAWTLPVASSPPPGKPYFVLRVDNQSGANSVVSVALELS